MHFVLKGFIKEFKIGISKYSSLESRQLQSISAKFSDWGSDYMLRNLLNLYLQLIFVSHTTLVGMTLISHTMVTLYDF